jgi:hypothetical protein
MIPEITISGRYISTFKHFAGFLRPQRKCHNLRTGS